MTIAEREGQTAARSGIPVEVRPGERQRRLDEAEATLAAALKERHPVVPRATINERYPREWVAILPTHVDEASQLIAGRLLVHAPERKTLERALRPLRRAHPALAVYVDLTGPVAADERLVRV